MRPLPLILLFTAFLLSCSSSTNEEQGVKIIEEQIQQIETEFKTANKAYLFSIFHEDTVTIQIIHPKMFDQVLFLDDDFGFLIHLTFQDAMPGEAENHEQFKNSSIYDEFDYYSWEGVPSYYVHIEDRDQCIYIVSHILQEVYKIEDFNKLEFELQDESPYF